MKNIKRTLSIVFLIFILVSLLAPCVVFADTETSQDGEAIAAEEGGITVNSKTIASGIAIGLGACGGAIGMGIATSGTSEAIARQPEAESKIRSTFMLGLVFVETAIIYALLVVILIIFVL